MERITVGNVDESKHKCDMELNGKGLVTTAMYIIAKRRFKWTRKLLHESFYDLVNICIKAKKKGLWSV